MSDDLPMGWVETELGEITQIVGGSTPTNSSDTSNFEYNGIPWITPSDLTGYEETYISRGRRDLSQKGFASCGTKKLPKGSVLFSSRAPIGYCVIAENEVCTNQGFKSFVLFEGIIPEFLRYYLITSKSYIESVASGTTFKEISASRIATVPFPLPPLNEQRRIVDKLERIGDRHRTARNELNHIPKLIARYKQAVLAAACSGKLTEDWREKNEISNNLKPVKLSEVATLKLGKMLDKAKNQGTLTPYLRNINVRWFAFDVTDIKEIRVSEDERKNLAIRKGDVMICEGGEPGRCAIWEGIDDFYVYQKTVYRLRPSEKILPEWVCYCLKNGADSGTLSELFTGTTIKHLTSVAFKEFQLLLPSLEEQKEIVRRVEKMFEKIDMMEEEYQKAAKLCDRLEQATLAKAFRGELVPQDPDDEPASVLLEQVKREKGKGKIKTKK
jgi:type I restriction enzyme S subunit